MEVSITSCMGHFSIGEEKPVPFKRKSGWGPGPLLTLRERDETVVPVWK